MNTDYLKLVIRLFQRDTFSKITPIIFHNKIKNLLLLLAIGLFSSNSPAFNQNRIANPNKSANPTVNDGQKGLSSQSTIIRNDTTIVQNLNAGVISQVGTFNTQPILQAIHH